MDFTRRTLPAQPYLYVERETPMEGPRIAEAMGSGFAELFAHLGQAGIAAQGAPMSVYTEMPSDRMRFRCGVAVSAADAGRAEGPVRADVLPEGDVVTVTHVGPYAGLNQTHRALWSYLQDAGLEGAMPIWEVYVDDPGSTPEAALRTEIHRRIG